MNKETTAKKTSWEKAKESFSTALMSAGIILVVLVLLWIPFKLIPAIFGNGTNFVSTTLSSLFISGDATSTVNTNDNVPVNTAVNTNVSNNTNVAHVNTQAQRYYYGKSDLQISLIGTGIIDPISKQFVSTNYAGSGDEIAIKFEVRNIGTNVTGAWKLRINTPSKTTPYYDSAYQTSIKPGDRIVYTTTFDNPITTGINTAYITADPLNMVDENYENNNQIIVPINVQGTFYNYGNGYNYGSNIAVPNLPYGGLYTWSNINLNCYANPQTSYVGSPVTWYAAATGGNGYYSYTWTGSDLLNSTDSSTNKIYYSAGTKTASVTVTSGGQSVTRQCSVNIY